MTYWTECAHAGRAKQQLALRTAPDLLIWTYKSILQGTLQPALGWGVVQPANNERGGGLEGTIYQPFPIMGVFQLKKE